MKDLDLVDLREIAEAASAGPWKQWNPATGPSHITIGGKVAFESLQSATRFADDEVIPHWCDATHIAAFDPETVLALLDRIAELETEVEQWRESDATLMGLLETWKPRAQAAEAKLADLRELHRRIGTQARSFCVQCDEAWPCRTVKTLEGDTSE